MIQAELQRLVSERWPVIVRTPLGVEVEGSFSGLEAERSRLAVELSADPPPLEPGDGLELFFIKQNQRWSMSATLHHFPKPTQLVLLMPQELRCADRRHSPRWKAPHGLARAVVKTALFEGLSLEGPLLSLSSGGFSFQVVSVHGPAGPMAWNPSLLDPSKPFESAEILDLPLEVEGEGRLLWQEGNRLGVLLRGLPSERLEALASFVRARAQPVAKVLELEPQVAPIQTGIPIRDIRDRSQALLRLKKRGRAIVLAMKRGHHSQVLRDQLIAWGYGRVECIDSMNTWLDLVHSQPVDLVLIDGGFKELQGLELASFFHQSRGDRNYAIVLAETLEGSSIGFLAKRAGVTQMLGKPYRMDGTLDALLESALDLRGSVALEAAPMPSSRYKRRSIALAMPPGLRRDSLQAFLLGEGFSRVMPAGTVGELIRVLQSPTLGLVFVDWEEASLSGLEVAAFLAGQHGVTRPQLVLAGDVECIEEEAHALGIARVVPKNYPLNGPLVRAFLEVMEGLEAAV